MFDSIAEVTVPIDLGGERRMVFNANTMVAFEKESGKMFLEVVTKLYDALFQSPTLNVSNGQPKDRNAVGLAAMKALTSAVSVTDLRALLWASLHEYDERGRPQWPLTVEQVGRLLTPKRIPEVFLLFLRGQLENMPSQETLGESQAVAAESSTRPVGGTTSTVVPVIDFG